MGFPHMLVGYMRVSSDSDRQTTDLQRDALLVAGGLAPHPSERALQIPRDGQIIDLDAIIAGLETGVTEFSRVWAYTPVEMVFGSPLHGVPLVLVISSTPSKNG
jgi:hypothetical protein